MKNPFTLSFGRQPENMIDRVAQKNMVIDGFQGENPSSQVYMITGVRGTGKTVMLTEVSRHFRETEEWIVIDLTPEVNYPDPFRVGVIDQTETAQRQKGHRRNV